MPLGTKVGLVPLGMKVGLGLDHIVLDGDRAPRGAQPPIFGPCILWPNSRPSVPILSTCCIFYVVNFF